MKTDKQFDFYEFTGIVMPGAILLAGLTQVVPAIGAVITVKDLSLGSLGVFLILAYAAGHLIQALGNVIELAWWKCWGGMPSDWVRSDRGHLLAATQRTALQEQVHPKLGLTSPFDFSSTNAKAWFALTRQIQAAVSAAGRSARVDTFNGNYGLNRGLAASLLVVAVIVVIEDCHNWRFALGITVAAVAAIYRMHRFGRHFASELFAQFLQLPVPDDSSPKKTIITSGDGR